jgi:hypothetical protein
MPHTVILACQQVGIISSTVASHAHSGAANDIPDKSDEERATGRLRFI